jgi:hypothetical protein
MATLVSVLGLSFAAQADPTVDLLFGGADSINVVASQTVTVSVVLTLASPDQTNGYQMTIGWDSTELSYIGGSLTNLLPGGTGWFVSGFGEALPVGSSLVGSISAAGAPAFATNASYTIGTLAFHVEANPVNDGTSDITAYLDLPNSFSTDNIADFVGGGSFLATTFNGAGVNVIPEPTTASLLGLGLLGLTVAGRRRG